MTALVIILSIIAATVEILAIAAFVFILNDMLKGRKSAKKGDDTHEARRWETDCRKGDHVQVPEDRSRVR